MIFPHLQVFSYFKIKNKFCNYYKEKSTCVNKPFQVKILKIRAFVIIETCVTFRLWYNNQMAKETKESANKETKLEKKPSGTNSAEIEKTAELSIESGMGKLDKLSDTEKKIFPQMEKLKEMIEKFREKLKSSMEELVSRAKGTSLEDYAKKLSNDAVGNLPNIIAKLQVFALKANSYVVMGKIDEIVEKCMVPTFKVEQLEPGTLGVKRNTENGFEIVLSPEISTYESFYTTVVHELAHAYVEAFNKDAFTRNPALNEGITEYVSSQVSNRPSSAYEKETKLASALADLNKKALMEWYAGGSDEDFFVALIESFKGFYSTEEAENIAQKIIDLGSDSISRQAGHADNKKIFLASKMEESLPQETRDEDASNILSQYDIGFAGQDYFIDKFGIVDGPEIFKALDSMDTKFAMSEKEYFDSLISSVANALISVEKGDIA